MTTTKKTAYQRTADRALKLINRKGQTVTWKQRKNDAPDDPAKSWKVSNETFEIYTPKVVVLPEYLRETFSIKRMKGSNVAEGTEYILMGTQDFIPTLKDTVEVQGIVKKIRYIDVLKPDGTILLYTVGLAE